MHEIAWVIISFCVLCALGVPIFVVVGISTLVGLYLLDIPLTLLAQTGFTSLQPFPLLTIPLFVLAGQLMEKGGTAAPLIKVAQALIGAFKGSLSMVTIMACAFFGTLSGSGPATTVAIGSITIPPMVREGYPPRYAAAVAAAAGALGSMIPPSNLMIIYCLVADESIPRLFLAGFGPGLLTTFILILIASVIAKKRNYGCEGKRFELQVLFDAIWEAKWAFGTPAIIFGGIYGGIFTPTEAAAVAVFYAAFSGLFLYKKLTLKDIYMSLRATALMAGLLLLLTPTIAFGQLVAFLNIPKEVQYFFSAITQSPFIVMLLIGALYIFLGTFMESLAQIIIFTPVLLPVTKSLGIDPILFGVFTVATCEIGFLTPPVGANLNVASRLTTATFEEISVSVVPFLLAYILTMYIIVVFPNVALYIPNLFFGAR